MNFLTTWSLGISFPLLFACGSATPAGPVSVATPESSPLGSPGAAPQEVLVKFKPEVPKNRATELLAKMGTEVIRTFKALGLYHVRIVSGESIETVIENFLRHPEVEYAEPNYIRKGFGKTP